MDKLRVSLRVELTILGIQLAIVLGVVFLMFPNN